VSGVAEALGMFFSRLVLTIAMLMIHKFDRSWIVG